MIPPVTYQGAKGRLAAAIVEKMAIKRGTSFYDICCGSGAVSLALIDSGHAPENIVMIDRGPWGLFWEAVGAGTFDLDVFRAYCASIPTDPRKVKAKIEEYHRAPVDEHAVYVFLLLQAAAIGGKAVWIEGSKWARGSGFRDYWLPTATSSRRSHVNPMMPMPETIFERVSEIVKRCKGLTGKCCDASEVVSPLHRVRGIWPAVAYIDPPYDGTTGYPFTIDAVATARATGVVTWVSEGRPLSECAFKLSDGRAKGGITGERKVAANEEWLSCFEPVECGRCRSLVTFDGQVWIDTTGGDVCGINGANEAHVAAIESRRNVR